jgi:glycosyltransferase involved in cell wall biosynthesis
MRVLIATNLFPNNVDPGYAPFNRQQFSELARMADVEVLGVVPWRFGRYYGSGPQASVVGEEAIDGMHVLHPRYPTIPGVPSLNAAFYALALGPLIARIKRRRSFDVLLAAYAYPDGCAGVALSRMLRVPVVVKCHGSDLNRVPDDLPARVQIKALLPKADAVVAVSEKLASRAVELGVPERRISVVYNGVDKQRFRPLDRSEARRKLKLPLEQKVVLYVGHLAEHKGTRDLLAATERVKKEHPSTAFVFVGDGPLAKEVQERAERGLLSPAGVIAVGRVSHDEVAEWIAACDVLCLPSWDEGLPNVLREALSAGRPVVATRVGGTPEVVHSSALGRLVPPRDPAALADALAEILRGPVAAPEEIVRIAVVPSWSESARALLSVLEKAVSARRAG